MSDIELQSKDDGYLTGSNESDGNEEINSKSEENEQASDNNEVSGESEEDESGEEESDEDESDSMLRSKRRGGASTVQSKRQEFLKDLVDSEAEDSSASEDDMNGKSLDEVRSVCGCARL